MTEFDWAAALRAYADAINDLASRVTELEGQVIALQETCQSLTDVVRLHHDNETEHGVLGTH